MKITKARLREIILEELQKEVETVSEFAVRDPYTAGEPRRARRMRKPGAEEEEEGDPMAPLIDEPSEVLPGTDPEEDEPVPPRPLRKGHRPAVGVGMRREGKVTKGSLKDMIRKELLGL
jgi:hypothetical protein